MKMLYLLISSPGLTLSWPMNSVN